MTLEVIDNYLTPMEASYVKHTLFGGKFPWFVDVVLGKEDYEASNNPLDNYQFIHPFYYKGITSPAFEVVSLLVGKVNPKELVRVKANLLTRTEQIIKHGFHIDEEDHYGKTAVYYVNTNNGKTIFEDGTEVDSVENRLVVFDSRIKHTGTTCTDRKFRAVINLNYIARVA